MANSLDYNQEESFDFGRVFGRAFLALQRNFMAFFITSIVIVGIPTFLVSLWSYSTMFNAISDGDMLQFSSLLVTMAIVGGIVAVIAMAILQGAVTFGAVRDFNDEPAQWQEMLSVGFRIALPLIGFGILSGLGIAVGSLLLLVPGMMLACAWIVGVPALVMEKTGVMGAFDRTAELTRGYRWWMLLAFVIYFIISFGIGLVQGIVLTPFGLDSSNLFTDELSQSALVAVSLFDSMFQVILSLLGTLGVASLYYELRFVKEGVYPESIVSVFD